MTYQVLFFVLHLKCVPWSFDTKVGISQVQNTKSSSFLETETIFSKEGFQQSNAVNHPLSKQIHWRVGIELNPCENIQRVLEALVPSHASYLQFFQDYVVHK